MDVRIHLSRQGRLADEFRSNPNGPMRLAELFRCLRNDRCDADLVVDDPGENAEAVLSFCRKQWPPIGRRRLLAQVPEIGALCSCLWSEYRHAFDVTLKVHPNELDLLWSLLDQTRSQRVSEQLLWRSWNIWLKADSAPESRIAAVQLLMREGIPDHALQEPEFGSWAGQVPVLRDAIGSFQSSLPCCAWCCTLLSIDADGNCSLVPRKTQDRPFGFLEVNSIGNLYQDRIDQIIRSRDQHAGRSAGGILCTECSQRGRKTVVGRRSAEYDLIFAHQGGKQSYEPREPARFVRQKSLHRAEPEVVEQELDGFSKRLSVWAEVDAAWESPKPSEPTISVEIPVIKGSWLISCIESVLRQSSNHWRLSLLWDHGDDLSHRILTLVQQLDHPRISIYFEPQHGIALSRRFLTERSDSEWILPVDDDDMLSPDAVGAYLRFAEMRPWSGIIRARRKFIDEHGRLVKMDEWFPFTERSFQSGMIQDVYNHCHPYLIQRRFYNKTVGWEGFSDFMYAGEDCDIFVKLEEQSSVELFDEVLYYYRLNPERTSHELKPEGAYEMWRRIVDRAINRLGLPLQRVNDKQPFRYERLTDPERSINDIDFVIPHYETNLKELSYTHSRPATNLEYGSFALTGQNSFRQQLSTGTRLPDWVDLACYSRGEVHGKLQVEFSTQAGRVLASGHLDLSSTVNIGFLTIPMTRHQKDDQSPDLVTLTLRPLHGCRSYLKLMTFPGPPPSVVMRLKRDLEGACRVRLEACLRSLEACGVGSDQISVITGKRSSAANRNIGFGQTSRPFVCFLDDDVEIPARSVLQHLLDALTTHKADLVGPKIVTPSGRIFSADPYLTGTGRAIPRGLGEDDVGQFDYVSKVPWLPTTLLLVRREVFLACGGFDEEYRGSQIEDVDFSFRAMHRGFSAVYVGTTSVVHYNEQRNDCHAENHQRFTQRWSQKIAAMATSEEESRRRLL